MIFGRTGLSRPEGNLCGCPLSSDFNTFPGQVGPGPSLALSWLGADEFYFVAFPYAMGSWLDCLDHDEFPFR